MLFIFPLKMQPLVNHAKQYLVIKGEFSGNVKNVPVMFQIILFIIDKLKLLGSHAMTGLVISH